MMTLFGYPIEQIYFYTFIIAGMIIFFYMLFGDLLEAVGEVSVFLNPVLVLAFIIFFSATGFIFEKTTSIHSGLIAVIALAIAFILDAILNVFILVPMANAEQSLSYTEDSLVGRVGKIILSVPQDGYGEIFIESKSGMILKPAASYDNIPIQQDEQVLVLEVKNGVLFVVPYQDSLKNVSID